MLGEEVFKVDFLFIDIFVQEPCVFFFLSRLLTFTFAKTFRLSISC